MSTSAELAKRISEIEELKKEYDSPVNGNTIVCPDCGKPTTNQNDKTWGEGPVTYYKTLYYCLVCGHHHIDQKESWTTDY